jgi:choline dehydrogenase-like flavoprotein
MNLTPQQLAALRAVCDALIPPIARPSDPDGYWRRSANDLAIAEKIALALDAVSPDEQAEFRQLLDLLASPLVGLTWLGPMKGAAQLTLQQREQLLQSWLHSRMGLLRKGFAALKKLTTFIYYGYSDALEMPTNPNWPSIGYPGPLSEPPTADVRRITPSVARTDEIISCDVVVVGSGAGGSVVAGELAEAGLRVIVLEKGPYMAENEFTQRESEMVSKLYEAGGVLTTKDGNVSVLAGSCVGGGTTVNWSASLRTPDYVLDAWGRNHDNPHFLDRAYLRHFEAVENALHVDTDESNHNVQNQFLYNGAATLGWDAGVIPRNAHGCTVDMCKSCGYCSLGCQRGTKQSTMKTYLQRAFDHEANIYADTEVQHIILERGVATGVQAVQQSADGTHRPFTVKAVVVVVSAGSIHTPALLLRSGLSHPHIGRNLNFHPTVSVAGRYVQEVNPWWGNMMSAISNEVARVDGTNFGAKIETAPIHSGLMGLALPWMSGEQHKKYMLDACHTAAFIVLTRDRNGGRVTLDKRGKPILHYTLSDFDLKNMLAGIAAAARIHRAAGAEELVFPHNSFKTFSTASGEAVFERLIAEMPHWGWKANQSALFTAHQMASCRMGGTRALHPVAPNGQTYEIRHLYVADASAFPECSGANPMLSTQALAHYIAQGIKESYHVSAAAAVETRQS